LGPEEQPCRPIANAAIKITDNAVRLPVSGLLLRFIEVSLDFLIFVFIAAAIVIATAI
jgi:hypothetical protein